MQKIQDYQSLQDSAIIEKHSIEKAIHVVCFGEKEEKSGMEKGWLEEIIKQTQLEKVKETNQYTEQFGLRLSDEDAALLVKDRMDSWV